MGVIKSRTNQREKAAGLKKEPNAAILLPGVAGVRANGSKDGHGPTADAPEELDGVNTSLNRRGIIGTLFPES